LEINFLRDCKIIVGDTELEHEKYEIEFTIDRKLSSDENRAEVSIFYISEDTKNLFSLETEIKILAGYKKGSVGLIFSGQIDKTKWNSKDGVTVGCTENNQQWTNEIVNVSFKSGNTGFKLTDAVEKIISSSSLKYGLIDCNEFVYERGLNLQGTLKSELTKLANVVGAKTYIKKNKIYFVRDGFSELETLISPATGLISLDKKDEGYLITSFINHRIEEDMILNIEGTNEQFKAKVTSVSHKFSRTRAITTIECEVIE